MKKRTILYRDGLVFIGVISMIFLGAFIRQVNLLLLFASILACFLFFDFWFGRRLLRGLTVRRGFSATPSAGEPFFVPLELVSDQERGDAWGIIVEDTIAPIASKTENGSPAKTIYRPVCYFEEIEGKTTVRKTWAGKLTARGRYSLGPVTISTRFPLGFFRSSVTFDLPEQFTVYPKMGRISREWLSRHRKRNGEWSKRESRITRVGEEMAGVRNWQSGDARKWIHWRASAKHQKILVRQFLNREDEAAVVLLDLYSETDGPFTETERENRELAVSFAATLWSALARQESERPLFGFVAEMENGEKTTDLFLSSAVSLSAETVLKRLAVAQPTTVDRLATLFQTILDASNREMNIVLITSRSFDPETSERMRVIRQDPRFRSFIKKIVVVDSSSLDFDEIFHLD